MDEPIVFAELSGIHKRFGGVAALSDVSVDIEAGTVHAFVGENGAGKSTLGKVLSGTYTPDGGTIRVRGELHSFSSPHDAIEAGIATIQQEIALVPGRTVIENVFLGREPSTLGLVRTRRLRAEFQELIERTGFDLPPDALVRDLRIADQQKVEILRAIARDASLIILDEPTAALTPDETASLMAVIASLKREGVTIVYVSHFLDEVLAVSDNITILRNGRLVRTVPARSETKASLIHGMLGREVSDEFATRPEPGADRGTVLRASGITTGTGVKNVSLEVREGEILGIAGLVGAGRSELLRGLFGADPLASGEVSVRGRAVRLTGPGSAIAAGIALISEDRKADGLLLRRSLKENISLVVLRQLSRLGFVSRRRERRHVVKSLEELDIRPAIPEREVGLFSGGNQQKALFAKWLAREPQVLLVDEPTRGVDIGAKFAIYEILSDWVAQGRSMVVVSSEVEELLGLADRILVMRQGSIVAEFPREDATQENIMAAAFGATAAAEKG
ncbi:MAG: sugar ABC transporter ATP-binding protein [Candidatus Leucobacter sulfamidivorax]|nr:sugar ABC transporter ATP-binding protein [Candidatus Leucobacter sulfamidivorax]